MNTKFNLKNLLLSFGIVGLATVGGGKVLAQASVTGSVVLSLPNGTVQSVSGEISLPSGYYYDTNPPTIITPDIRPTGTNINSTWIDDSNPQNAANLQEITNLKITAGTILSTPDYESMAAQELLNASNLSDIVSLIRAYNPNTSSSTTQATALGNATVVSPNGITYSVSGEMALPAGFYYADSSINGSGILDVTPNIERNLINDSNTIYIYDLTIDPGVVTWWDSGTNLAPLDFNSVAAYRLREYTLANDLSGVVSIVRAGQENGLMDSKNRTQARITGSATIALTNSTTMSVSGEFTLPPGMYYENDTDGSPLKITPLYDPSPAEDDFVISQLGINPNSDPNNASNSYIKGEINPWDFNSAVTDALNNFTDISSKVSIIRAGSGNMGLD